MEALCVCALVESCDALGLYGYRLQSVPSSATGKECAADFHGDSSVDDGPAGGVCRFVFVETADGIACCMKNKLISVSLMLRVDSFRENIVSTIPKCVKKYPSCLNWQEGLFFVGAAGRSRTGTPAKALDFESSASANSATAARKKRNKTILSLVFRFVNGFFTICFRSSATVPTKTQQQ